MPSQPQSSCAIHSTDGYCDAPNINECSDSRCKEDPDLFPSLEDMGINEDTPDATLSLYKIIDTSAASGDGLWRQMGKSPLMAQSTKELCPYDSSKRETSIVRPGDILEWRQVEIDEMADIACKNSEDCVWGAFTGVIRCMNTPVTHQGHRPSADPGAVKHSTLSFVDPDSPHGTSSTPCQAHTAKPLGSREGFYPTAKVHTSDLIGCSPFVQPSSLAPRTPQRSFLTNTAVSPSYDFPSHQSSSSMIIKQPRPNTTRGSPSHKSYRPRSSEETQPVEVKLDGLGGAIITFAPLVSPSPSRTVHGLCHTVDCSPRRCFPKTALSFGKRATLSTHSKENDSQQQQSGLHDDDSLVASNEAPDSPSHAVVHTAQMHGNSLSKTKPKSIYRTVNLTPTRDQPKLRLAGLSSSPPAPQRIKQFTVSEGIMLENNQGSSPPTTPLKLSMDQHRSTHLINEIAKLESKHQAKEYRLSTHTAKLSNVRDVPVSYDSFIESPLQTRDRDIMHSLSLSPIELCSLGLHNGRTMTPRAKAISALQKLKQQQSKKIGSHAHQ